MMKPIIALLLAMLMACDCDRMDVDVTVGEECLPENIDD